MGDQGGDCAWVVERVAIKWSGGGMSGLVSVTALDGGPGWRLCVGCRDSCK